MGGAKKLVIKNKTIEIGGKQLGSIQINNNNIFHTFSKLF
jgi:hypothetical protein